MTITAIYLAKGKMMDGQLRPLPLDWVKAIYRKLTMLWGDQFIKKWEAIPFEELMVAWSEELAGYTPEELKTGLADCKDRSFPVSLPEFMQLCRPQKYQAIFDEAVTQTRLRKEGKDIWSSPSVFWAAAEIGNDLLSTPYEKIKPRWEAAVEKHRANLSPIPVRPPQIAYTGTARDVGKLLSKIRPAPTRVYLTASASRFPAVQAIQWKRAYNLGIEPEFDPEYRGPKLSLARIRELVSQRVLNVASA
jgi:hypothetical protein